MITAKVEGFDAARKVLDVLPDKFQRKIVNKFFRRALKIFTRAAQQNLLQYGGQYSDLAKAIGVLTPKASRTKGNPVMIAGIRVKGKYKYTGYYGHWIEYGVRGVKSKLSSSDHRKGDGQDKKFRVIVARKEKGERYRADQPPRPFMRPAVDQTRPTVESSVIIDMQEHIDKEVGKQVQRLKK